MFRNSKEMRETETKSFLVKIKKRKEWKLKWKKYLMNIKTDKNWQNKTEFKLKMKLNKKENKQTRQINVE